MDKTKVPNYLDKSNFSGIVRIKTSSEERMSDEEVETVNTDSSQALLYWRRHRGLVSGGEYEVQRGNFKDGDVIECLHSEDNGSMRLKH